MFATFDVPYAKGPGFAAAQLAYLWSDLSMLILLPERTDGLPELEVSLSRRMLDDCVARMTEREVSVVLPRFRLERQADMRRSLAILGMTAALDPARADFSGMNGRRAPDPEALMLSNVPHQASVAADEEGIEAAAATSVRVVMMCVRRRPPIVFRADRPFLFAIRDDRTGAIVFLGRVIDPTVS